MPCVVAIVLSLSHGSVRAAVVCGLDVGCNACPQRLPWIMKAMMGWQLLQLGLVVDVMRVMICRLHCVLGCTLSKG